MSTPLLFNIYFVTADNRTVPLQFVQSPQQPDQGRLSLDQSSSSQNALFVVDDLPPFLQDNQAFYLGKIYTPKIQLNNQQYYLSQVTDGRNLYDLIPITSNQNASQDNRLFNFALLNSKVGWGVPDVIANLHLDNIFLNGVVGYRFNGQPAITSEQPLVYSPANCQQPNTNLSGPTFCGPAVCPEDFSANGGTCTLSASVDGIPFGVRTSTGIYTYKIRGNQIYAAAAHPDVISADIETNDTVRERWFFAEPGPGQNTLSIGGSYPIFIITNDRKFYLTNPQYVDQNAVRYTLSPTVIEGTARFNPTQIIQPRTLVDLDQFENFIVPNQTDIYLWSFQSQPLVNSGLTTSSLVQNQKSFLNQPVTTQYVSALSTVPPVTGVGQSGTPITSQWWFWLLIVLGIILIIGLIIGIIYWSRPKPQPVYSPFTTTTTRVTSSPLPILA